MNCADIALRLNNLFMKLVSYLKEGHDQLGLLIDDLIFDADDVHPELPSSMNMFLNYWEDHYVIAQVVEAAIKDGRISKARGTAYADVKLLSPVPFPSSCRDAYAFRQHVETARKNRGAAMINAFFEYPVFYFSHIHSIQGAGNVVCMPDHLEQLDYELEVAIVISKAGRNIKAEEADEYIAGLMIMNDMSARKLQLEEMLLNLGPAKGKDFATAFGPALITLDELKEFEVAAKENHVGKCWNLNMRCSVNGIELSNGNLADMEWTFAEIIERASYGVTLYPGDIIGSGTVGTGCLLELNGTGKLNDPSYTEQWLKEADVIEMEVTGLGKLTNSIVKDESDFSILQRKKTQTNQ
jgi:fumarylacetoacetate (FAA) hydrolase